MDEHTRANAEEAFALLTERVRVIESQFERLTTTLSGLTTLVDHLKDRIPMLEYGITKGLPAQLAGLEAQIGKNDDDVAARAKEGVIRELSADIFSIKEDMAVLKMFRENATEHFVTHKDLQAVQVQAQFSGPSTITEHSCSSTDPKIAPPERFTGKREDCKTFLSHLGLYLDAYPRRYSDDTAKIRFAISYLGEGPSKFFQPHIHSLSKSPEERAPIVRTYQEFCNGLSNAYGIINSDVVAEANLRALKQTGSAVDYTNKFRTFASDLDFNDSALCFQFIHGLKEHVQRELAKKDRIVVFEELAAEAIRIDNLEAAYITNNKHRSAFTTSTQQRTTTTTAPAPTRTAPPPTKFNAPAPAHLVAHDGPGPMDLSHAYHISEEEKARRTRLGLCWRCASPEHFAKNCTLNKGAKAGLHNAQEAAVVEFSLGKDSA